MECKCDDKDMLKIVRGNAFAIELKVEAKRLDGTTVEDFDLATAEATLLVRHNDTSTEYEYLLASKNVVTVNFESLQLGWYGMEMSGSYDGQPWRWRVDDVFQIVETNAKANVPAWSILTDSTYMVGVAMSLYQGGDNVQADWNEKDERSAAYIKNKPEIYTKSEVDATIAAEETRARAAEQENATTIANEVTRATEAEQTNATAIATEETRAKAAEQENATAIADEVTRATAAEQANATAIAAEETRAKAAEQENATAIANEVARATTAEQANATAIATEETRARAAEQENATAIADEVTRATAAEQNNATAIAAEETRARAAEQENATAIAGIEEKIPIQATAQNKLADRDFVNSSISTATADFKGTYNSLADLQAVVGADDNDYGFVVSTDAAGNTIYKRYKYVAGTGWAFEYDLNNSSFTAAQWEAIQSGMTAALTEKLVGLPTNAALQEALATINSAISAEETRAMAAEQVNATALANEVTRATAAEEANATAITSKQDIISDLDTIRSGAAAGATAYQKPGTGVPKTDLASGVQTSLDKADAAAPQSTTYTKTQVDGLLAQKQDTLTFDDVPTENSNNPVKSGGVYAQIKALQDIIADLEIFAEGYVRVAGSSSPALSYKSYKYHEQGGFGRESAFSLFYPCLVGTPLTGSGTEGKILYVLKKFGAQTINGVAKWEDLDGNMHNIDGSEGDVMICNIEKYYRIFGKHTINGVEYDVFLMSRIPFTWQNIEAEEVGKYGCAPDYCVAHTDSDNVIRMHSVYNPSWNGSYNAPSGVTGKYVYSYDGNGNIVETYDANETMLGGAGGLHTTDLSLPAGEQRAMNNNPDTTKTVPWMNYTAAMAENLMIMLLAEGGTFDSHNANLMGSGFTSNDATTSASDYEESATGAKNGLRVMDTHATWKYYAFGNDVKFLVNGSSYMYGNYVLNVWRNPWHIMEAQRAISYAIQNDVHELEWFVFEGNKYKWRSVNGFAGPAEGEMTCVVWKLLATQAGSNAVDPTDSTTSIAGNRVEVLLSTAMIHGITTQVSPCWWTSGLVFTEDEDGTYKCYMERDQSQLMITPYGEKAVAEGWDFETKYKHIVDIAYNQGYARDYNNDALMLPLSTTYSTGGSLHTYVGKYNWFTGGKASAGNKAVRGFLCGNGANFSSLSPLTMYGSGSPSSASSGIAFGTCCQIVD